MTGPVTARGFKFSIGNTHFRIWKNGWEYLRHGKGRWFFFYWHPARRRKIDNVSAPVTGEHKAANTPAKSLRNGGGER